MISSLRICYLSIALPTSSQPLCLCLVHAGPCISTDTACSSSLVAAHLAHKGLLLGESTAAVVAGSNIMLSASTTTAICQLQVCHAFDSYTCRARHWAVRKETGQGGQP